jgi:hypothetical protein
MIKPSPNPPPLKPVTRELALGECQHGDMLLSVRAGIPLEVALGHASRHLNCATATAFELVDNSTPEYRTLARSVVLQLEVAKALLQASMAGMDT